MLRHLSSRQSLSINVLFFYDTALNLTTILTSCGHIVWMITERPLMPNWPITCNIFDVIAFFNFFFVATSGFGVVFYRYNSTNLTLNYLQ